MDRLKCLFTTAALVCSSVAAVAQNSEYIKKTYPHMFFGIDGGMQTTFTNYQQSKLITPYYGVSLGGYFSPVVGTRLSVGGFQNKGGIKQLNTTYEYKNINSSLDLLINLTNIFSENKDRFFNVVLFGGVGLGYAWDNDDINAIPELPSLNMPYVWDDDHLSHLVRAGLQLDFNFTKNFGMNLGVAANNFNDRFNSKTSNKNDWQVTASVGLVCKFGHKKEKKSEPAAVITPAYEIKKDTVWYDDVTYKTVSTPVNTEKRFYYEIRESVPMSKTQINEIVEFVKTNKNCKISITSYADKGTGTPSVNMEYSKKRAENIVKALVDAGVDKNIITYSYKGDTVQPYKENDKNRVSIVVVSGEGAKQEKVVTKKYDIKETQVPVEH